jgi:hypothetical protein
MGSGYVQPFFDRTAARERLLSDQFIGYTPGEKLYRQCPWIHT